MKSTQVTTWRRYTAAEKKAYRARVARRRNLDRYLETLISPGHFFADNYGSTVPTARVNGELL